MVRYVRSGRGRRGRLALVVICGAAALAVPSAWAQPERHHHDHDRARHAVERGEALPLAEILQRVRDELGGEIVGIDFEREDGRWVYEFRVIAPSGWLGEVCVDAASGAVIRRENR